MIFSRSEKRSSGPLFAFIDLLFLIVAFFTLLIFFTDSKRSEAEAKLETAQQKLADVSDERDIYKSTMANLGPLMDQFKGQQRQQAERRRRLSAREARRRQRPRVKVIYQIFEDGQIVHEGQRFTLDEFKQRVTDPLRKTSWISFRAFALPETPFGAVVRSRRVLLEGQGEFDTYWDNLTNQERRR